MPADDAEEQVIDIDEDFTELLNPPPRRRDRQNRPTPHETIPDPWAPRRRGGFGLAEPESPVIDIEEDFRDRVVRYFGYW